jgi:hypothetical protein
MWKQSLAPLKSAIYSLGVRLLPAAAILSTENTLAGRCRGASQHIIGRCGGIRTSMKQVIQFQGRELSVQEVPAAVAFARLCSGPQSFSAIRRERSAQVFQPRSVIALEARRQQLVRQVQKHSKGKDWRKR